MKIGSIEASSKQKEMPLRRGDLVFEESLGNGTVVGFSSISGEPHVFFYSVQKILCVGSEMLTGI